MENYLFLYQQNDEKKVIMLRLPIGTTADVETWQGLFQGFKAELLCVVSFTQLVGGAI